MKLSDGRMRGPKRIVEWENKESWIDDTEEVLKEMNIKDGKHRMGRPNEKMLTKLKLIMVCNTTKKT